MEASNDVFREMVAWYEDASEINAQLIAGYVAIGRSDDAWRILDSLATIRPEDWITQARLAAVAARRDDRAYADSISNELAQQEGPYLRGSNIRWRARIAASGGGD